MLGSIRPVSGYDALADGIRTVYVGEPSLDERRVEDGHLAVAVCVGGFFIDLGFDLREIPLDHRRVGNGHLAVGIRVSEQFHGLGNRHRDGVCGVGGQVNGHGRVFGDVVRFLQSGRRLCLRAVIFTDRDVERICRVGAEIDPKICAGGDADKAALIGRGEAEPGVGAVDQDAAADLCDLLAVRIKNLAVQGSAVGCGEIHPAVARGLCVGQGGIVVIIAVGGSEPGDQQFVLVIGEQKLRVLEEGHGILDLLIGEVIGVDLAALPDIAEQQESQEAREGLEVARGGQGADLGGRRAARLHRGGQDVFEIFRRVGEDRVRGRAHVAHHAEHQLIQLFFRKFRGIGEGGDCRRLLRVILLRRGGRRA